MQRSTKILFSSLITIVFFSLFSCGGGKETSEQRKWSMRHVDSLWSQLSETRKLFVYKIDEIENRKMEMDSVLLTLKFVSAEKVDQKMQSEISQYNAVFRVYRTVADKYKNAVLTAEDAFYKVKVLDKSVKDGVYDKKTEEFKKEYAALKKHIIQGRTAALEITGAITAVEPAYQRLAPVVEEFAANNRP